MRDVRKMVIGCGYLGRRVAARWQAEGADVWVATRHPARAAELAAEGFQVQILDVTRPDTLSGLPPVDTLLYAIAFDPRGPESREAVTVEGLRHVLEALPALDNRLIYISTTGVYGQRQGEWVDESSPCLPERLAGQCYRAAERLLQADRWGERAVILRLAGIYGPGRVPYLDRLRAGKALAVDPSGYLNLIHVDDAVRVIQASERCKLPNLFVVSDGTPVPRASYYQEVGRWLGREPSFVPPDPASPQAERAQTSKRICNRKLMAELQVPLAYPDYRQGLAAILAGGVRE